MTRQNSSKSPDCRRVVRDLFHYEAGELPEPEMRSIARHLEQCPECAGRERIESAFRSSIKSRLRRAAAPPELRDRIVAGLPADSRSKTLGDWLRVPWLLPALAALLLVVLLVPGLPRLTGVMGVERDVVVVDIDCELAGRSLAQQRLCDHPHHLNALRSADGSYWNVGLGDKGGRLLASDRDLRGAQLTVRGDLYARIRTLRVESYDRTVDGAGRRATRLLPHR